MDGRRRLLMLAICATVAVISLFLAHAAPLSGDEVYHYPLAKDFLRDFPVFSDSYTSAYTPLPYVLAGAWMRVAGSTLFSARVFNLIVGLVGLFGFLQLARRVSPAEPLLPVAFLAFQPYYLRDCFIFYVGNYGLVAVIWALRFYLGERNGRNIVWTGALLGIATLCSQWALPVLGGVLIAEALRALGPGWSTTRAHARDFLAAAVALAVFQIPVLVVFARWHGLTHPRFAAHTLQVSMEHATGTLSVVGFVFAWWLLGRLRSIPPRAVVTIALFTPLLFASLPEVSLFQGAKLYTGLTVRILAGVSGRLGLASPLLIPAASLLGVAVLYLLYRSPGGPLDAVRIGSLLLIVAFSISTILGETHVAFVIPLLFLLAWAERGRALWIRLVVAQSSLLGIAYAFYFALIKAS